MAVCTAGFLNRNMLCPMDQGLQVSWRLGCWLPLLACTYVEKGQ